MTSSFRYAPLVVSRGGRFNFSFQFPVSSFQRAYSTIPSSLVTVNFFAENRLQQNLSRKTVDRIWNRIKGAYGGKHRPPDTELFDEGVLFENTDTGGGFSLKREHALDISLHKCQIPIVHSWFRQWPKFPMVVRILREMPTNAST